MSKKERLSQFLDKSGLLNFFLKVSGRFSAGNSINILTYHRVNYPGKIGPFDPSVIDATPEGFEKQVEFLKENFAVISFGQLENILDSRKKLEGPAVILTFDDGYRDTFTQAFPVLRKHGLPATVFLSTGIIDRRNIFWWEKIHFFFLKTTQKNIAVENASGGESVFSLASEPKRRESIGKVIALLKQLPDEKRKTEMTRMETDLKVEIPSGISENFTLTWDQIRRMSREGIEFGSHTVNHPILSKLDDRDLAFELAESKKRIESEINQEVMTFCYPVGLPFAYNSKCQAAVGEAGYRFAATVSYGTNFMENLEKLALKRINVNLEDSRSAFKTTQAFPFLFKY